MEHAVLFKAGDAAAAAQQIGGGDEGEATAAGAEEAGRSSDETGSETEDGGPVVYGRAKLVRKRTRPPAAEGAGFAPAPTLATPAPTTPPATEPATEGGTKRRRVSRSAGAVAPALSAKRLHTVTAAREASAVAAEERSENRRRKLAQFRVWVGSHESPSASAVAVAENGQLYVALTNDSLYSRQFGQRSDQSAPGVKYLGNAVQVGDMAADGQYLYALDREGVTWRVDRRHLAGAEAGGALPGVEPAQWASWDTPAAPLPPSAARSRPPNRCIALCGGFMYAIDDDHRLLRTALDEVSADSVATERLVSATDRQWSTVAAWEAFSHADEDKIPIGITSSHESMLVACADGTICVLPQLLGPGNADAAEEDTIEVTFEVDGPLGISWGFTGDDDDLIVAEIGPGTPAQHSQLVPGLRLVKLGGHSINALRATATTNSDIVTRLKQRPVTLTLTGPRSQKGSRPDMELEQGQVFVLKLPLLPTVLRTEWTSLAAADAPPASYSGQHSQCSLQSELASQRLRLFASAVTKGDETRLSKPKQLPVLHCLCSDGDDVWSLHRPGDFRFTSGEAVAADDSGSVMPPIWRVEELSVRVLGDSDRDGRILSNNKQRTSGAAACGKQEETCDTAEEYRTSGHEWIGKKVKRLVIRRVDAIPTIGDAVIVSWLPKGRKKDEPAMWKIKYLDSESEAGAAVSEPEPDMINEDLLEKEARDAIQSATPEGYAALQALRNRIQKLDTIAAQRRDEFIRSQPAFAGDQQAGRQSLMSGYLVWVLSEGKWWPAQIFTPLSYLQQVIPEDAYCHFMAKQICDSAKPDSLFVVFLNKQRHFEWAAWRPQPPECEELSLQRQPRDCVHDFRKHYRQHKASTSGNARLKALQDAEDVLGRWLGSEQALKDVIADERVSKATRLSPPKPVPSRNWRSAGHEWVGRQVKRWRVQGRYDQHRIHDGRITAWKPKATGQPALWKVEFALDEGYEELQAGDASDAIDCATPQGFAALQALQKQITTMEVVCTQRRDHFIRNQPAFAEDQSAGRTSLISGYLVFAKYNGVWWPAQLFTPFTYMKICAGYSHTIAKGIVRTKKLDRLFVAYLDDCRSCSWVHVADVHDFRLHRSRHVAEMMKDKELSVALGLADATLADWIHSDATEATDDTEASTGSRSSSSKLSRADSIPLSPRGPVRSSFSVRPATDPAAKAAGPSDPAAKAAGPLASVSSSDSATNNDKAVDNSSVATKKQIDRADEARYHDVPAAAQSADADVAAALRDAAREVLAQFAQKIRLSKGTAKMSNFL